MSELLPALQAIVQESKSTRPFAELGIAFLQANGPEARLANTSADYANLLSPEKLPTDLQTDNLVKLFMKCVKYHFIPVCTYQVRSCIADLESQKDNELATTKVLVGKAFLLPFQKSPITNFIHGLMDLTEQYGWRNWKSWGDYYYAAGSYDDRYNWACANMIEKVSKRGAMALPMRLTRYEDDEARSQFAKTTHDTKVMVQFMNDLDDLREEKVTLEEVRTKAVSYVHELLSNLPTDNLDKLLEICQRVAQGEIQKILVFGEKAKVIKDMVRVDVLPDSLASLSIQELFKE